MEYGSPFQAIVSLSMLDFGHQQFIGFEFLRIGKNNCKTIGSPFRVNSRLDMEGAIIFIHNAITFAPRRLFMNSNIPALVNVEPIVVSSYYIRKGLSLFTFKR